MRTKRSITPPQAAVGRSQARAHVRGVSEKRMAHSLNTNQKKIAIVLGLLYIIEVVASVACNVTIIFAPLAALVLVAPAALVGFAFSTKASFVPAMVGIFSMAPLYIISYRFDCNGWGSVFLWYYAMPIGFFTGWLGSRVQRKKVDDAH